MRKGYLILTSLITILGSVVLSEFAFSTQRNLITIDGSSTIYPITEAVAEEFRKVNPEIRVIVGVSGTGGGFKKFSRKEIDINNASRVIRPSEVEFCKKQGVEYIELPVAYDGLAVVVNPQNHWVKTMTVEELKTLWRPEAEGKVLYWSEIRPEWPKKRINLYGPGVDSGTYDYFTEAIVGKRGASRTDFVASEDDNILVQGVATDPFGLGYFGLAYYEANKDILKPVAIDDGKDDTGKGGILPTFKTVAEGTYQPLSRPLFIYVRKDAAKRPEVRRFVEFYLRNAKELVKEVGYIPLSDKAYKLALRRFKRGITGSVFGAEGLEGMPVEKILRRR